MHVRFLFLNYCLFVVYRSLALMSPRSCQQRRNLRPKGKYKRRKMPRKPISRHPTRQEDIPLETTTSPFALKTFALFRCDGVSFSNSSWTLVSFVPLCLRVSLQAVSDAEVQKGVATIEIDFEPDSLLPRAIVLDLSAVNFLDTVGVKMLCNV